ncbi:MAG: GNAT family N-acetyltransferase [Rhizobiaceae bacterium]
MKGIQDLEPIEVTVTFLEMTKPPLRYLPAPLGAQIAVLRVKDIPLHYYRYLMDRVGRKWHWVNSLRLSDEELSAAIHSESRDIRVFYLDGAPAGFFDLDTKRKGAVELVFFGMMAHAIGRGFGRWFLGTAIEAAWSHHPDKVVVQTCTLDHPSALALYQKAGFVAIAQSQEKVVPLGERERADILFRP